MKLPLIVSLAACGLALSACGNGNTGSEEANITEANQVVDEATPLPPAIADSRPYRCADGSVFFVDFLADGKTVNLRTEREGLPTTLTAEEQGGPYVAEGYSVGANAEETKIATPDKPEQSCKA